VAKLHRITSLSYRRTQILHRLPILLASHDLGT